MAHPGQSPPRESARLISLHVSSGNVDPTSS